jgi:hypothetical protein
MPIKTEGNQQNMNACFYSNQQRRWFVGNTTLPLLAALSMVSGSYVVLEAQTESPQALAAQIANDMTGRNEGSPHGIPSSWNWAQAPVIGLGNAVPVGWNAATAWGIIYIPAQGNPATNTCVNISSMKLYFLSQSTHTWTLAQSTSQPDGEAYRETFSGNSIPADVIRNPDGTQTVCSVGQGQWAGYNYHFYPGPRGQFNGGDVGGWVAMVEARLVVQDPSLPDDRSQAQYLLSAGADYWPSVLGVLPASYGGVTPSIGNGKLKYVQIGWRSFCMTSMTAAQLAQYPPPIDFTGILP